MEHAQDNPEANPLLDQLELEFQDESAIRAFEQAELERQEEAEHYADWDEWRAQNPDYENPQTGYEFDYIKHAAPKTAEATVPSTDKLSTVSILGLRAEKVPWLWEGYIALGVVTVVEGDPDLGKTFVLLDLMARVSNGQPMPFAEQALLEASASIIASAEDNPNNVLKPRLMAAGASDKIYTFKEHFILPNDLKLIEGEVKARKAKLLVVDPGFAYFGDKIDPYSDVSVRKVMSGLTQLASAHHCAVIFVRHLNKSFLNRNAKHRGGGSIGITAAARSVLLFEKAPKNRQPEGGGLKVVEVGSSKSNQGATPMTLGYRLVPVTVQEGVELISTARVDWLYQSTRRMDELQDPQQEAQQKDRKLSKAKRQVQAAIQLSVEGLTAADIAKTVGVRKTTVGEILDELVAEEWAKLEIDDSKKGRPRKLYKPKDEGTGESFDDE